MEYNKDYTTESYNIQRSKFAFIGFIVGIVPFILILGLISLNEGGIKYVPSLFRNTLVIAGIITSLLNAYFLSKLIMNKLYE